MDVNVSVRGSIVFVRVRVNVIRPCSAESPDAYSDQHDSNEPFGPGRQLINREPSPEHQRENTHDNDPSRVSKSPSKSRLPGIRMPVGGKRSYRRQMIRSGKDMDQSSHQS